MMYAEHSDTKSTHIWTSTITKPLSDSSNCMDAQLGATIDYMGLDTLTEAITIPLGGVPRVPGL